MSYRYWLYIVIGVALLGWTPMAAAQTEATNSALRVVGRYSSYSVYEDALLTDLPYDKLTHLYYGPIGISENGQCESTDEWADTGFKYPGDPIDAREAGNFKQLAIIKEANPTLQVIMDLGGWENSDQFSIIAADEDARVRLATSCLQYMRDNDFDGINIDWRYPVAGGLSPGDESDVENFRVMLEDFNGQIEFWEERDDEDYVLTITAPAAPDLHEVYRPDLLQGSVDWINLTAYGFRGAWSEVAAHQAPLYGNPIDPGGQIFNDFYNVDGAVDAYLDYGVPANKIVVGISFYAQAWRNVRPGDLFGMFEPNGGIPSGTRDGGLLYYRDLEEILNDTNYIQWYDDVAQAAWLYNERRRIAISYENLESLQIKGRYIDENRLGGVFIWEVSYDAEGFPLLTALTSELEVDSTG